MTAIPLRKTVMLADGMSNVPKLVQKPVMLHTNWGPCCERAPSSGKTPDVPPLSSKAGDRCAHHPPRCESADYSTDCIWAQQVQEAGSQEQHHHDPLRPKAKGGGNLHRSAAEPKDCPVTSDPPAAVKPVLANSPKDENQPP